MRTVRNITVAVAPEFYRQTRRIAAASATPATPAINIPTPPEKNKFALYACIGQSTPLK
jgi:hypothetical protein